MNELLGLQGWNNYDTCPDCDGQGAKRSWNNTKYPDYEVVTRDRRQTFIIKYKNRNISGPWIAGVLELKLQEQKIYAAI